MALSQRTIPTLLLVIMLVGAELCNPQDMIFGEVSVPVLLLLIGTDKALHRVTVTVYFYEQIIAPWDRCFVAMKSIIIGVRAEVDILVGGEVVHGVRRQRVGACRDHYTSNEDVNFSSDYEDDRFHGYKTSVPTCDDMCIKVGRHANPV
jgi:hypothetical protein